MWLNWPVVSKMPWRQRNAAIEAALRSLLASKLASDPPLSTMDLARALVLEENSKLAQVLTRMAPHMHGFATHDGEPIVRFGRRWQRWQWHGQKSQDGPAADTLAWAKRTADPDFDPTCVLCQAGEDHEH